MLRSLWFDNNKSAAECCLVPFLIVYVFFLNFPMDFECVVCESHTISNLFSQWTSNNVLCVTDTQSRIFFFHWTSNVLCMRDTQTRILVLVSREYTRDRSLRSLRQVTWLLGLALWCVCVRLIEWDNARSNDVNSSISIDYRAMTHLDKPLVRSQ